MYERWLRFLFSSFSTVLTLGVCVAMLWGLLFGVGPPGVLFWAVLGPPAALLLGMESIQGIRRLRGEDVRAERRALALATAAQMRARREIRKGRRTA